MERLLNRIPTICHDDLRRIATVTVPKHTDDWFTCPLLPSAETNVEYFHFSFYYPKYWKMLQCVLYSWSPSSGFHVSPTATVGTSGVKERERERAKNIAGFYNLADVLFLQPLKQSVILQDLGRPSADAEIKQGGQSCGPGAAPHTTLCCFSPHFC